LFFFLSFTRGSVSVFEKQKKKDQFYIYSHLLAKFLFTDTDHKAMHIPTLM
jgi:hypothetical protein